MSTENQRTAFNDTVRQQFGNELPDVIPSAYNGADQLVKLDETGKLPAVPGDLLTGITPGQIGAATSAQGSKADTAAQPADITITNALAGSSITPVADGTYIVGFGNVQPGIITVSNGIITAIQIAA